MLLQLFGYIAFLLPVVLGALAWIAMFGLKRESKGENDRIRHCARSVWSVS